MQIKLRRKIFTSASTIGEIYIDDEFECLTLEDPVREKKIKNVTAIPSGSYEIILNHSPKFGRIMPRLEDVPNFSGILIHWGNTAAHTEGCILVGKTSGKNFIGSSKSAFNSMFRKIEKVYGSERITIDVSNSK